MSSTPWIGSALMACIRPRTPQPCGTSSEIVLTSPEVGDPPEKVGIMPSMPVTVNIPPNTTPPCLVSFRNELMNTPKEEALKMIPAAINATEPLSPQWILKIKWAAKIRTTTCTNTIMNTDRNLPVRMVACGVGVVNSRGRVRSSSSRRMLSAVEAPV